eukprot:gene15391-biopygen12814
MSLLKEDRQAFGLIIAKASSLEEAFEYPISSVPLSIATPDATLRQSEKASLRNFLINDSSAFTDQLPKNAHWLVDGMAAVRSLKPKETYSEWIKSFITLTTHAKIADARSLGIINDTDKECSIKCGTRQNRGSAGQRVQLEGFKQHMLQGEKWQEFFHSGENKNALISLMSNFLVSEEGRNHLNLPTVVTSEERTIKIKDGQVIEMFNCNHEEADTRLILHAVLLEGCYLQSTLCLAATQPRTFTEWERRLHRAASYEDDSTDADMNNDDEEHGGNRVRRESGAMSGDERREQELDYNADNEDGEEHEDEIQNDILQGDSDICD